MIHWRKPPWILLRGLLYLAVPAAMAFRSEGFSVANLHRFQPPAIGSSSLVLASDGMYYGLCERLGESGYGFIFRMSPEGVVTPLVSFGHTNGAFPSGTLVEGGDGALYGTTDQGGAGNYGTVFRITTNGALTSLVAFGGTNAPFIGLRPSGLTRGSDGAFYGGTSQTIFRITMTGDFLTLATFTNPQGVAIRSPLAEGSDGSFYGTAQAGGASNGGTVFRVTTNGSVTVLASFNNGNGAAPLAGLIFGADGALYGTTSQGGGLNGGVVFRCSLEGVLTVLHSFYAGGTGYYPRAPLVQTESGLLYGSTSLGTFGSYGSLFQISTNGAFATLANLFSETNAAYPTSAMIVGNDGALYGTTAGGGTARAGTAYRLLTNGTLTVLASFFPRGGAAPLVAPVQAANGFLYGTTSLGGSNGVGTVFVLAPDGSLVKEVSFLSTDGANPSSPLFLAGDGQYYGVARAGGPQGSGSVYRFTENHQIVPIAFFDHTNTGSQPCGPLCLGDDGALYGTAAAGGAFSAGTVFRVTTNGALTALAAHFIGNTPESGVVRGKDGNFYGTCSLGGTYQGGTVFRVTPAGVVTTLVSFNRTNFGWRPLSNLAEGRDGAFYGTTFYSPGGDYGTLYRVTTNGVLTRLATLGSGPRYPRGMLVLGSDGALYGTSIQGGSSNDGTIYRFLTNGTGVVLAFFSGYGGGQSPESGVIFGQDGKLYGTTSSGQNGSGHVFRVDLSSEITYLTKFPNVCNLTFSGIPGVMYRVQRASSPMGPWHNLGLVSAGSSGLGLYDDFLPLAGAGFYRLRRQ